MVSSSEAAGPWGSGNGRRYPCLPFFLLLTKIFHFLLAIVFITLNIQDMTTTRKVLKYGGYEANLHARLLTRFHLFLPVTIIMILLILPIMIMADEEIRMKSGIIYCGIYSFTVLNNLRTLSLHSQD
jgi:hypothetical protein